MVHTRPQTRPFSVVLIAAALLIAGPACEGPGGLFSDRDREQEKQSANVTIVQSEVMSYADTFISAIAQAWNGVASDARADSAPSGLAAFSADTDMPSRQRRAALHNKLANASSALAIATCPNPYVAVADMITMVTLQRMVLETPESLAFYGPENGPELVEVYREQEQRAWRMADHIMTPAQRQDLATLIAEWRVTHPKDTYVANVRLEDFSAARQQTVVAPKDKKSGSLLAMIWLDPLAGLDPAEREVHKTRLLGERMFYYASRSPQILKWQVETLYQDLLAAPEFKQTLGSVEKASDAASRISGVAEQLPANVATERQAALDQFFTQLARERQDAIDQVNQSVTGQREALVAQLEESQGKLQESLREFRATAETTNQMAASVTTAIHAADTFAARFDDGPDDPQQAQSDPLGDFRQTAAQAGDAADRLTVLARSLDDLLNSPGIPNQADTLRNVVLDVNNNARSVISFAFWRLLILCVVAPFAVALAALLYRWAVRQRWNPTSPKAQRLPQAAD